MTFQIEEFSLLTTEELGQKSIGVIATRDLSISIPQISEITTTRFQLPISGLIGPHEIYDLEEGESFYPLDSGDDSEPVGYIIIPTTDSPSEEFSSFIHSIAPVIGLKMRNELLQRELNKERTENIILKNLVNSDNVGIHSLRMKPDNWSCVIYNRGIMKIFGFNPDDEEDIQIFDTLMNDKQFHMDMIPSHDIQRVEGLVQDRLDPDPKGSANHYFKIHPRGDKSIHPRDILTQVQRIEDPEITTSSERLMIMTTVDITSVMEVLRSNEVLKYFYEMVLHNIGNVQASLQNQYYFLSRGYKSIEILAPLIEEGNKEIASLLADLNTMTAMIQTTEDGSVPESYSYPSVEINTALISAQAKLKAGNIDLKQDFQKSEKFIAKIQPIFLKLILKELLTNAIKYKGQAPSIIAIGEDRSREGYIGIVIEDNGLSIPAEDQLRIFEKNWRGSNSINSYGTGNGLFLTRELLRSRGGDIEFEQIEGEDGVRKIFKIFIPTAA